MLIRTGSGGGTQGFLAWLASPGRRLAYSAGFTITDDIQDAILKLPARARCEDKIRCAKASGQVARIIRDVGFPPSI